MKHLLLALSVATAAGVFAAPPPSPRSQPAARPVAKPQPGKPLPPRTAVKPGPRPVQTQPVAKPGLRPVQPLPVAKPQPRPPVAKPQPRPPVAKPQPRPTVAKPQPKPMPRPVPPRHEFRETSRSMHVHGAGLHCPPPRHDGFHANRPHGARFWGRPPLPPPRAGYLHAWHWVPTPWSYYVDGVYYYGEGYYFDGYNYCYNGGFHFAPPPTQPAYVVPGPVVVQQPAPVVVQQPVAVQPAPVVVPPPPPPPRRGGLLGWLFGD